LKHGHVAQLDRAPAFNMKGNASQNWSARREIFGVELLKFGEPLSDYAGGNPEPSSSKEEKV